MKLSFEDFVDMHDGEVWGEFCFLGCDGEPDSDYEVFQEDSYEEYLKDLGKWKGVT
jgi:hypothetical protein